MRRWHPRAYRPTSAGRCGSCRRSKNAAPGDKLYLQSVYPVVVSGRILVPPGTYVSGTVTDTKRPGRIKGKGQIRLQFEQMILPNGTIREFVGSLGSLDGGSEESLD